MKAVNIIYLKSLVYILLVAATAATIFLIVNLLFVDFIHGNPHRTTSDTINIMVFSLPALALVTCIVGILVLALPQFFQAFLTWTSIRQFGKGGRFSILFALPLTAVLTWYCFDYLTPHDFNLGINEGADWRPYEHGLTLSRFAAALVIQAPVTLFNFCYFESHVRQFPKKVVVLTALGLAVMVGSAWGYLWALGQYQFL